MVAFGRLYENEFITLESLSISGRRADGMDYLDETVALARLLGDGTVFGAVPAVPSHHALHATIYATWPDVEAVVMGRPLHLRAIFSTGLPAPHSTSMMNKRGVPDLSVHLVEGAALFGEGQADVLAAARSRADESGMKHVLILTTDGLVIAAGPTMHETQSHWSNVEFAARIECLAIEERMVHGVDA